MLPTPDLSHLKTSDYDHVYEPAEDSFLFLDSLESEQDRLKELCPCTCLEVGCGSGVVSTFLAKMLGPHNLFMGTDINPQAASVTCRTAAQNKVDVQVVITNLVSSLLPRLEGRVDVLLFNPPYVVTPSEEVGSHGIEASWAGGVDGREVIDRFLPLVPRLLSDRGVFYMVIIKENKADDLARLMAAHGFVTKTVLERRSGRERLSVLRFTRDEAIQ